jgi:hypothetical protein
MRCWSNRADTRWSSVVPVYPFIIGQAFQLLAFRDAVRHILRHVDALWITARISVTACRKGPSRVCNSAFAGSRRVNGTI